MVGEAHHGEDYERGNPDLDPVAESAVYELEKRLDKMEKFELTLNKDKDGYGLSPIWFLKCFYKFPSVVKDF